ncbi:MAG: hypothetical protein M0P66_12960 [Salinivirgaceae bacterium]|nr:hypothetical protein [Salinivirgaceae bacterium]
MHSLQLRVDDKIYDHFLWLLSKFDKEEIEIINDDPNFFSNKNYLQQELDEINEGKATFISQKDLENRLDQIV